MSENSGAKKQAFVGLFLFAMFCVSSAFAQEKSTVLENQCELFGKEEFAGTEVSINVTDAELHDVLTLANPFGCNFSIDETVEKNPVTVKVKDIPWNLALKSIIEMQDLAIEVKGLGFQIVKAPYKSESANVFKGVTPSNELLYTEFVQLKNIKLRVMITCIGKEAGVDPAEYENTEKFIDLIKKKLSRSGAVEIDARSNTLIITDTREKLKLILDSVKFLDEAGFTLEVVVNNPNFEIK